MNYAYTTQNSLGWHRMRNRKAARPLKHPPPETMLQTWTQKVSFCKSQIKKIKK